MTVSDFKHCLFLLLPFCTHLWSACIMLRAQGAAGGFKVTVEELKDQGSSCSHLICAPHDSQNFSELRFLICKRERMIIPALKNGIYRIILLWFTLLLILMTTPHVVGSADNFMPTLQIRKLTWTNEQDQDCPCLVNFQGQDPGRNDLLKQGRYYDLHLPSLKPQRTD